MDRRSASTPRGALNRGSSEAQENQEPVDIKISLKPLVAAPGLPVKAQRPNSQDTGVRKLRRALHSIDSNRPRREVLPPVRPLSNASLKTPTDATETKKQHGQASSIEVYDETIKDSTTSLTGFKRPISAVADVAKTPVSSETQPEQQESENLAWMDMLLALLEKRYSSKSSLPVCLTDLEAANIFQLPKDKKLKTGTFSSVKPRTSLDISRSATEVMKLPATSSTNSQQTPARFDHERGLTQESKRQRLLLQHAHQIQASSVSSSTSCGCKTGCLKMYCMCFSSRGFCHAGCACDDCKNGRKNQTERVEAIQNYLANDPRAFSFASTPQDANTTDFLHLLPQKSSAVVMRGCRCKKSKCLKKYCECFQNGIACTSHCRCMECSNHSESTAASKHPHLQKGSATIPDKHSESPIRPKPFHPVHITVTKQPRRNHVGKTLRLNL
ncbi:hypothetical protein V7S43_017321 [Phytophthora oleae]|uniref:CRC domain-containing protein n=1 Tax=Phytophthora oleae TaxID=2107226 RepID=A0ABD3EU96_9STRA